MTISQKDYGATGDGAELVPGGLRVYRHYRISVDGLLRPTTTSYGNVQVGVNVAACMAGESYLGFRGRPSCTQCGGRGFKVERRVVRTRATPRVLELDDFLSTTPTYYPTFDEYIVEDEVCCDCINRKCNAPDIECTCGFYASYSPDTDFFSGSRAMWWGVPKPPIFAVAEASGRVLMGSKGVRAEKMEVKALAVDLSHITTNTGPADQPRLGEAIYYYRHYSELAAKRYKVPTYGSNITQMVRDFPQPDLSNLLKNQES
jgi:hypothetical protein